MKIVALVTNPQSWGIDGLRYGVCAEAQVRDLDNNEIMIQSLVPQVVIDITDSEEVFREAISARLVEQVTETFGSDANACAPHDYGWELDLEDIRWFV